jgi:hypothetical protein
VLLDLIYSNFSYKNAMQLLFTKLNQYLDGLEPNQFQQGLWSHVSARTKLLIAINIVVLISGGLALDTFMGRHGQWLTNIWAFTVFGVLLFSGRWVERWTLIICMLLGAFGEIILSLVWRLYDYQFGNLPLFVPPGHALLMLLGVLIAQRLDNIFYTQNIVGMPYYKASCLLGIPLLGLGYAIWVLHRGTDAFGTFLFLVFLICMVFGRAKTLYVIMFLLALIMELYGTALANWRWALTVPAAVFHPAQTISAANPPFAAGTFYCLLDLIVISIMARQHNTPAKLGST